ncbi:uncharacterized protein TNCV_2264961 [Trichonephila clavipes]|nr:uncharacterized protein TNCV_2264961 [Trichonephila clavipes]
MLQTYVIPTLQQRGCLQKTIFLHDGATPHIASSLQQLLRQVLIDEHVNCQSFPTAKTPRSPRSHALRPLVMELLKDNIYREPLATALDLKNSIRRHKSHL